MALLVGENLSLSSNLELERRKAGRRERWLYNIVQICRGIALRTLYIYHSILAIWETMMSFLKKSTILTNHYFIKNDRKSHVHCALCRSSTVEEEMLALHPVRWQLQSPQYSNILIFFDISHSSVPHPDFSCSEGLLCRRCLGHTDPMSPQVCTFSIWTSP